MRAREEDRRSIRGRLIETARGRSRVKAGACYHSNIDGNRGFFCDRGGPHYPGDACGTSTECVAGAQCLDQGGTMNCYQVCTDTCDAGDCTDTELGFKVCVAEA